MIFLEKASGALEHVESSSGAISTAVNRAIETLVPIVAQAPASDNLRDKMARTVMVRLGSVLCGEVWCQTAGR